MTELLEMLITGKNGKILLCFTIFIFFIYTPFLITHLKKRNKNKVIFEHENKDAIKVYLGLDFSGTLTVYSVNGKDPTTFYESVRQGFYLFPGKSKIGVQYHWADIDKLSFTGYKNHNVKSRKISVYAEKDKFYSLDYSISEDKYKFKEVNI